MGLQQSLEAGHGFGSRWMRLPSLQLSAIAGAASAHREGRAIASRHLCMFGAAGAAAQTWHGLCRAAAVPHSGCSCSGQAFMAALLHATATCTVQVGAAEGVPCPNTAYRWLSCSPFCRQPTAHRAALCHPVLQPNGTAPNGTVVPTLLCGPSAPAAASRLLPASPCRANPAHGAAPHHQHCTAQGVHGSCSAPAGGHRFSCTTPLLTVLTLHGPLGCVCVCVNGAGPVAAHLLPFNAESLQPQGPGTAVQHHPPTHSPEPTELQPPAGPASPPHRQRAITPPSPPAAS